MDPHRQVLQGGPTTALATTSTGRLPVPEPPACMPTNATGLGAGKTILGSSAPFSLNQEKNPSPGRERPCPSPTVPATGTNSFGGVVTPVNVLFLYQALSNHPDKEYVNKLYSELQEGDRIGYSGPRYPQFSKNVSTALLNPEDVTANLVDEVSKGRTMGPFPSSPFKNFQVSPIGLVPKKHSDKFRTIFHLSFPKSGSSSINYFIEKDDFSLQYITIDNAIAAIQNFGPGCYLAKTDIESAFRLYPVHPDDWGFWGCFGRGNIILTKSFPSDFDLPLTFSISCQMPLSGSC